MHTIRIHKRELHLMAYIGYHGGEMVDIKGEYATFHSDKSESEWRVGHAASESLGIDQKLLVYRRMFR